MFSPNQRCWEILLYVPANVKQLYVSSYLEHEVPFHEIFGSGWNYQLLNVTALRRFDKALVSPNQLSTKYLVKYSTLYRDHIKEQKILLTKTTLDLHIISHKTAPAKPWHMTFVRDFQAKALKKTDMYQYETSKQAGAGVRLWALEPGALVLKTNQSDLPERKCSSESRKPVLQK